MFCISQPSYSFFVNNNDKKKLKVLPFISVLSGQTVNELIDNGLFDNAINEQLTQIIKQMMGIIVKNTAVNVDFKPIFSKDDYDVIILVYKIISYDNSISTKTVTIPLNEDRKEEILSNYSDDGVIYEIFKNAIPFKKHNTEMILDGYTIRFCLNDSEDFTVKAWESMKEKYKIV